MKSTDLPQRRSIRLKDYDYAEAGFYFVTVCTRDMKCILGDIVSGEIKLSAIGEIVTRSWLDIPRHFPNVDLGRYVVMPNHLHGLFAIHPKRWLPHAKNARAQHAVPLPVPMEHGSVACPIRLDRVPDGLSKRPAAGSVGSIVRSFKAAASKRVREKLARPQFELWQRNYYESVLRNPREIRNAERYIIENPARWRC